MGGGEEGASYWGTSLSPGVLKCATCSQSFFTAVRRNNQTHATHEHHLLWRKVRKQEGGMHSLAVLVD